MTLANALSCAQRTANRTGSSEHQTLCISATLGSVLDSLIYSKAQMQTTQKTCAAKDVDEEDTAMRETMQELGPLLLWMVGLVVVLIYLS